MTMRIWEPEPTQQTEGGAGKYHGAVAAGYDAKRQLSAKWQAEQRIIQDMLGDLPERTVVLDVPVGTGRFLEFYRDRGFECWGVDTSRDMLALAARKPHGKLRLGLGDVRNLHPIPDKAVDVAVMVRMSRWLEPSDFAKALRELQRVARQRIIFTARVRNHPHARTYEMINAALDGWRIASDEAGYHEDYRIISLERR